MVVVICLVGCQSGKVYNNSTHWIRLVESVDGFFRVVLLVYLNLFLHIIFLDVDNVI